MIRFCHNHGLIQVSDRPQWWTVPAARGTMSTRSGASPTAAEHTGAAIERDDGRGVRVITTLGRRTLTRSCWPPTATRRWRCWRAQRRRARGAGRHPLPAQPRRAAHRHLGAAAGAPPPGRPGTTNAAPASADRERARSACTTCSTMLQPLPWQQPVVVSLNPVREIAPAAGHGQFDYAHPVFDLAAIRAQAAAGSCRAAAHLLLRRLDGLRLS
jgi:hypothetical protein